MDLLSLNFTKYTQWSGILTIAFLILTIAAFIFKWGIRFRLVGVTGFMGVLTAGIFGLSLGLLTPVEIPGAIRYTLVYDNGATKTVITIPSDAEINQSSVKATLNQAAIDLFSRGRVSINNEDKLTIRLRTILHPEAGISQPVYLGEVKRSLFEKNDENIELNVFADKVNLVTSATDLKS